MITFSKDIDKKEGIIRSIILPDIKKINSDDTLKQINENIFENFSEITANIFKNIILAFEIFQLPPLAGLVNDFPVLFNTSKSQFKLSLIEKNPNAYSDFINNIFSLFDPATAPASDLVLILSPLTIQLSASNKKYITDEEINDISEYLKEVNISNLDSDDISLINSYLTYFIFKFIASNFLLTFIPAPPLAPIVLPLIPSSPLNIELIKNEFKEKIDNILLEINSI
jgi:hypothetical protein